jgi:hypothetical protein
MIAYLSVWRNISTTRKIALEDEKECLTDSSSITASKPAANGKGCGQAQDMAKETSLGAALLGLRVHRHAIVVLRCDLR